MGRARIEAIRIDRLHASEFWITTIRPFGINRV